MLLLEVLVAAFVAGAEPVDAVALLVGGVVELVVPLIMVPLEAHCWAVGGAG